MCASDGYGGGVIWVYCGMSGVCGIFYFDSQWNSSLFSLSWYEWYILWSFTYFVIASAMVPLVLITYPWNGFPHIVQCMYFMPYFLNVFSGIFAL